MSDYVYQYYYFTKSIFGNYSRIYGKKGHTFMWMPFTPPFAIN